MGAAAQPTTPSVAGFVVAAPLFLLFFAIPRFTLLSRSFTWPSLLSGVGLATAHSRMEGLRRQCATQIVVLDARDLRFTVSMGVASFPHTAHTQEEIFAACENALAEARRRGGNHVTLASIRFDVG